MAEYFSTPIPSDKLSISAPQISNNFAQLNTSFSVDHYPYANPVATNGFHNQVTTPTKGTTSASDPTTTTNPIFFANQYTTPLGVLQFSRGPSNSVSTPVTSLMSTSAAFSMAPSATVNVLDFTGINIAMCELFFMNANATFAAAQFNIFWTGAVLNVRSVDRTGLIIAQASGNILQLSNTSPSITYSNVYWTLKLQRIS